jgi:hypothetical protein
MAGSSPGKVWLCGARLRFRQATEAEMTQQSPGIIAEMQHWKKKNRFRLCKPGGTIHLIGAKARESTFC